MSTKFDAQSFRRVLGQFATGITVVAAADQAGRNYGITANSFSSVSLDPPLVLVCIGRNLDFYPVITTASHFSVNILAADQEELSRRFATKSPDKFAGLSYRSGRFGAPLLADTLGYLECSRYELLPGGDHIIVLGKVEHLEYQGGEPLLYFGSRYRWLLP
jgi:flavin reductase (DIM6/NTAB) family NADH-FMN oxidoreductase RutF